jgi:hypothetical protein
MKKKFHRKTRDPDNLDYSIEVLNWEMIADQVYEELDFPIVMTNKIISCFLRKMRDNLAVGKPIYLKGVGFFSPKRGKIQGNWGLGGCLIRGTRLYYRVRLATTLRRLIAENTTKRGENTIDPVVPGEGL